jgi:hypothetical protein
LKTVLSLSSRTPLPPFPSAIFVTRRWYARAALCRAGDAAAAAAPLPVLEAGDRVQLASGWASCDDALKGPLRPGEVRDAFRRDTCRTPS